MSETPDTPTMSPLMDSGEGAAYLKVSESTLSRWRSARTGPPFIKLGGINEWLCGLEPGHAPQS